MRLVLAAIVVLSAAATPVVSSAQTPQETAAARRLYEQGVAHASAARWEEARVAFAQSLALAERPATLLNLAGALVQTGHFVAGSEMYRRYLREADDDRHREDAQALLAELEARLARVALRIDGLARADELRIDGDVTAHALVGVEVPFDPGAHFVTVTRDGETVASAEFTLNEREHRAVTLRTRSLRPTREVEPVQGGLGDRAATTSSTPVARGYDDVRDDDRDSGGGGVLASPWFWVVVGVVVVGGGVTTGVLVANSGSGPDAFVGNVGSGRLAVP